VKLDLHIWRQESSSSKGQFCHYKIENIQESMSFLEMLDILNEQLIEKDINPIAFEHDCREGICGSCSLVINGIAHGPEAGTTVCQLHMRSFQDQDSIYIEPWRAGAFPVLKDLIVDRRSLDKVMQAGGFVSTKSGSVQDANNILIGKETADNAMDAASCIGCGACVAACKNSSAMLFTAAKVTQLATLPQGKEERSKRVLNMVTQMDLEGFGHCSNTLECEAVCPKSISVKNIAKLNREYTKALLCSEEY